MKKDAAVVPHMQLVKGLHSGRSQNRVGATTNACGFKEAPVRLQGTMTGSEKGHVWQAEADPGPPALHRHLDPGALGGALPLDHRHHLARDAADVAAVVQQGGVLFPGVAHQEHLHLLGDLHQDHLAESAAILQMDSLCPLRLAALAVFWAGPDRRHHLRVYGEATAALVWLPLQEEAY